MTLLATLDSSSRVDARSAFSRVAIAPPAAGSAQTGPADRRSSSAGSPVPWVAIQAHTPNPASAIAAPASPRLSQTFVGREGSITGTTGGSMALPCPRSATSKGVRLSATS